MLLVIGDHPLTPWEKIAIIFLGGSIVMITMLIVACIVFPTCALFKWLNRGKFFSNIFFYISFHMLLGATLIFLRGNSADPTDKRNKEKVIKIF